MSTKDEIMRQMMMAQNTAYSNQSMLNSMTQSNYKRNPLEGYDIASLPVQELEQMLVMLHQVHEQKTMDMPLPGAPTKRQLLNNEALRNAWEAYEIVKKLVGI